VTATSLSWRPKGRYSLVIEGASDIIRCAAGWAAAKPSKNNVRIVKLYLMVSKILSPLRLQAFVEGCLTSFISVTRSLF